MKTIMKFSAISFMLISMLIYSNAQSPIKIDASFYSEALDEVMTVDVYLPWDYYVHPEIEYATVYFLHGASSNQNGYAFIPVKYYQHYNQDTNHASPPAIFVLPDGSAEPYLGSGYVNSELYGHYEDYIMQDVIQFTELNFRVMQHKNFRFISGHSMGGFGSAHLSVSYPGTFRACIPFSGFLAVTDVFLETWRSLCYEENGSYNLHYGAGTNTNLLFTMCGVMSPDTTLEPYPVEFPFDTLGNWVDSVLARWYGYDQSKKVRSLPGENELSWYLVCGTQDYMETLSTYEAFMDSLDAYDIAHDQYFFIGGHQIHPDSLAKPWNWLDSIINLSYQSMGISFAEEGPGSLGIYPNPVSSTANITYKLASPAYVELDLFDQLGRLAVRLFEGNMPEGVHQARLDATPLPPGVYLCRLQSGRGVAAVKVAVY